MPRRKHAINQDFFSTWSPDMAYILGYFIADGNVSKQGGVISITLHNKDIEFLHYMNSTMGSSYPLKRYTKGKPQYVGVYMSSIKLVADLAALGVLPNKRASWHGFTDPVPDEYKGALVRGFFDGDGWICLKPGKYRNMLKAGFANKSETWLQQIRSWAGLSSVGHLSNRGTYCQLEFANRDSLLLRKFMYDDNFSLTRKRLKYFSV